MSSVLPTAKLAPTRINPKIMILYGLPKVGKTTALAELDSCLILDAEEGASSISSLRIPMTSIEGRINNKGERVHSSYNAEGVLISTSLIQVVNDINEYGQALKAAGQPVKFPYRRIAIDTLDKFEDMCEVSATRKYKDSIIGKTFEGNSVLELPKGAGYYHLRNEVLENIDLMSRLCETLILNCHTKEKITEKGGIEVTSKDLSLTGKLGAMVCAKADIITYLYREPGKPLMGSLETSEGGVMGARKFPQLEALIGSKFEFAWDKLLVDPK